MKKFQKIIWGIVLLAAGVILALNALGVTKIDIWFPGWWTLFIIIPCGVGLITERDKVGNGIGLVLGVSLLLKKLGYIESHNVWEILGVAVFLLFGFKLIFGDSFRKRKNKAYAEIKFPTGVPSETAVFGGRDMNFDGVEFDGCEINAVFGGVDCDLSHAIIERDCKIKANAVFGGVDIILPKGINLQVDSTSVFGGVDDNYERNPDSPVTLYIEATSVFGGVDIK